MRLMPLTDKVALITGASRGIGASIAHQLTENGATVFLAANDTPESLEAVIQTCTEATPSAKMAYGVFDFVNDESATEMVRAALKAFGRVDILVNNAAIRTRHPFGNYSIADFDQTIAVNLKAPFFASQAVVPVMIENGGGRIIHIASQMGLIAEQDLALYGLAKAALIHLTMSMAFELAPHNIMVNAVSPGPTMTEYNVERTTKYPEYKKHKLSYIRSGRYSTPEEIAEVVTFLATTRATNIQGHNLVVDGGYVIH
jgi:NAD(P)-dependent dehydrogenase (short-subunit alcohol dehydrogenase family)